MFIVLLAFTHVCWHCASQDLFCFCFCSIPIGIKRSIWSQMMLVSFCPVVQRLMMRLFVDCAQTRIVLIFYYKESGMENMSEITHYYLCPSQDENTYFNSVSYNLFWRVCGWILECQ